MERVGQYSFQQTNACHKSTTTGSTRGTGISYPVGAHEYNSGLQCACVVFCESFFVFVLSVWLLFNYLVSLQFS